MTNPKLLTEPESTEPLDRLAPNWQLRLNDGAVIDPILKVINRPRKSLQKSRVTLERSAVAPTPSPTENNFDANATWVFLWSSRIVIGSSEEVGMITSTLVR